MGFTVHVNQPAYGSQFVDIRYRTDSKMTQKLKDIPVLASRMSQVWSKSSEYIQIKANSSANQKIWVKKSNVEELLKAQIEKIEGLKSKKTPEELNAWVKEKIELLQEKTTLDDLLNNRNKNNDALDKLIASLDQSTTSDIPPKLSIKDKTLASQVKENLQLASEGVVKKEAIKEAEALSSLVESLPLILNLSKYLRANNINLESIKRNIQSYDQDIEEQIEKLKNDIENIIKLNQVSARQVGSALLDLIKLLLPKDKRLEDVITEDEDISIQNINELETYNIDIKLMLEAFDIIAHLEDIEPTELKERVHIKLRPKLIDRWFYFDKTKYADIDAMNAVINKIDKSKYLQPHKAAKVLTKLVKSLSTEKHTKPLEVVSNLITQFQNKDFISNSDKVKNGLLAVIRSLSEQIYDLQSDLINQLMYPKHLNEINERVNLREVLDPDFDKPTLLYQLREEYPKETADVYQVVDLYVNRFLDKCPHLKEDKFLPVIQLTALCISLKRLSDNGDYDYTTFLPLLFGKKHVDNSVIKKFVQVEKYFLKTIDWDLSIPDSRQDNLVN